MIKPDLRVAYRPLGMSSSAPVDGGEHDSDDGYDDDGLVATDKQYHDSETRLSFEEVSMFDSNSSHGARGPCNFLSFGRLRSTLYLAAAILFLIFVARLTTNSSGSKFVRNTQWSAPSASFLKSAPILDQPVPSTLADSSHMSLNELNAAKHNKNSERPVYDNYLLSVLRDRDPNASNSNQTLDDLQISESHSPSAGSSSGDGTKRAAWWTVGSRMGDEYLTVTNYVRAMKSFKSNSSITLTTQATTEFMHHILELCKRWDGPISVALFGPGGEMSIAMTMIKFMRQCLPIPLATCIRDKVSWHIVYNRLHGPEAGALRYPKYYVDSQHYPLLANQNECPKLPGPEPGDLIKQFELKLKQAHSTASNKSVSYRQQFNLTYPINVLRNIARLAATTHFILASDVELYPSVNLVPKFFNLIRNKFAEAHSLEKISREFGLHAHDEGNHSFRFVFTLPIFEVKSNITAPRTKEELVRLFKTGDAIFFHKWVCDACQNFPNRMNWLEQDKYVDTQSIDSTQTGGTSGSAAVARDDDDDDANDTLVIFEATQRDKSRDSWEPIFIGSHLDPLYDDRLTWEGRRDKMGQMYEMCLQDYHLFVLGNAFLVHAPGIKHIDSQDVKRRYDFIRKNNLIYDESIKKLRKQYAYSKNINKC